MSESKEFHRPVKRGNPGRVRELPNSGTDLAGQSADDRRALIGLTPEAEGILLHVAPEDFRRGRSRRFGTGNPEEIREPFWEAMIRAGIGAYQAEQFYLDRVGRTRSPVWCAERFGQSLTTLPDSRVIQIGGEHEDSYMKDFCIYNDVFVHQPDGRTQIFGYPESTFPPTGFHTATSIGDQIYIIGSAGYQGARKYGTTPVHRLDTGTFRMETVQASGASPGWISGHQAIQLAPHEMRIWGGEVATWDGQREAYTPNGKSYVLDIERLVWRCEQAALEPGAPKGKVRRHGRHSSRAIGPRKS